MANPRSAGLLVLLSVILWLLLSFYFNLGYLFALVGGAALSLFGMLAAWARLYATVIAIQIGAWVTLLPALFAVGSCIENSKEMDVFICSLVGVPYFFIFGSIGLVVLIVGIGLDIAKRSVKSVTGKIQSEHE